MTAAAKARPKDKPTKRANIVEAMDGRVLVESRIGSGSTFSFTLHRA